MKRYWRHNLKKIISALIFLVPALAFATIMVPLSMDDLAGNSDIIVQGIVTGRHVFAQGDRIFTEYTIRVSDVLKGAPGGEVKVVQPGGELGRKGLYVAGVARFAPAEEVILFLGKDINGSRDVVGWAQGKFQVRYDEQTKTKFAAQQLQGLSFANQKTGTFSEPAASRIEVNALKAQIKTAVAGKKGAGK